jgi:hypothetical protein
MRVLRAVVALGIVALALTACSRDSESSLPTPSGAFCQAAYDYDTNLPKLIGKINQQTELVAELAAHAPRDIAADAQTYLDAMERRAAGDQGRGGERQPARLRRMRALQAEQGRRRRDLISRDRGRRRGRPPNPC